MTPILTRLYMPEDIGAFTVFGTFIVILTPLMSLGNDIRVINDKNHIESRRSLGKVIFLTVIIMLISTAFIGLIIYLTGMVKYWYIVIAPLAAAAAVITAAQTNRWIRLNLDDTASKAIFTSLTSRGCLQCILGTMEAGLMGLIVGEIIGRLVVIILLKIKRMKTLFVVACKKITVNRRSVFNSHSCYLTLNQIIENLNFWLLPMMLTLIFNPLIGGVVAIFQRISSVPLAIYNQSVANVFHRSLISAASDSKKFYRKQFFINLRLISFATCLVYTINIYYGLELSTILFGEKWVDLYKIGSILIPITGFQLTSNIVDKIFLVREMYIVRLLINCGLAILTVSSILICKFYRLSDYQSLSVMSTVLCVYYVIYISSFSYKFVK